MYNFQLITDRNGLIIIYNKNLIPFSEWKLIYTSQRETIHNLTFQDNSILYFTEESLIDFRSKKGGSDIFENCPRHHLLIPMQILANSGIHHFPDMINSSWKNQLKKIIQNGVNSTVLDKPMQFLRKIHSTSVYPTSLQKMAPDPAWDRARKEQMGMTLLIPLAKQTRGIGKSPPLQKPVPGSWCLQTYYP